MMESSTEHYDKLKKKYDEYIDIYRFFNGGSTEGVTTFAEFYWRFMYTVKYADQLKIGPGSI